MKLKEALKRLEEIVQTLENGVDELEEIVKLFEEGSKLAFFCTEKLEKVENRIVDITQRLNKTEEN